MGCVGSYSEETVLNLWDMLSDFSDETVQVERDVDEYTPPASAAVRRSVSAASCFCADAAEFIACGSPRASSRAFRWSQVTISKFKSQLVRLSPTRAPSSSLALLATS